MRIEYHRTLIADAVRNEALFAALRELITPGETTVADIGAGTGLLGLMAAKLGAKDVFLYETAEVAKVAAQILKANKARNIHLFPCHSTEMENPPRVDLVVSETLGNYALEENIIATMHDARRRHLRRGGRLIPAAIEQSVCPVVSDRIHREFEAWDSAAPGLDLSAAKRMSLNNVYVRTLTPEELFEEGRSPRVWDGIDLTSDKRSSRRGGARWPVTTNITIHGFAVWWTCTLTGGISLSTAPGSPPTHWEQLYFPLPAALKLMAGEVVEIEIRSKSSEAAGTHLSWVATRRLGNGQIAERHALDLDAGYLP